MDVGESPLEESQEFCSATLVPGTMSLCQNPVAMKEGPDGKLYRVTRLIEGGNRGGDMNIPLCDMHAAMWDKNPSSFEIAIPPTPPRK